MHGEEETHSPLKCWLLGMSLSCAGLGREKLPLGYTHLARCPCTLGVSWGESQKQSQAPLLSLKARSWLNPPLSLVGFSGKFSATCLLEAYPGRPTDVPSQRGNTGVLNRQNECDSPTHVHTYPRGEMSVPIGVVIPNCSSPRPAHS